MSYVFKKTDVFDFAGVVGQETKEKGDELFFKYCPYCKGGGKDQNTFSVNLNTGAFKCFRATCGKQGHFVELARDFQFKLDFEGNKKKYRSLPQKAITSTDWAAAYMASRGIGRETTERYRLTTQTDHRNILVFPFYDENNVMVSVKYRKTDFQKGKDKCKEWFERDTKPILFGMAQCVDFGTLIITEGQIDSLTVSECGFDNAVSVPTGAAGFTWLSNVWDWIIKFHDIIVFGDYENGSMSLLDTLEKRLPQKVRHVRYDDYLGEKDANDIYRKYGAGAIEKCIFNAEVKKIANVKDLSEVKNVDINELPKIKTNIREVDRIIGGLIFGQVVLLSGKRGNGKSTFMSQLVCEALEQGESVFVYSGELADYHFKRWLDYQLAGSNHISTFQNEYGDDIYRINNDALEKINLWYKGRAFIYDNNFIPDENMEYESLLETIENVIKQYGVRMICIDNLMTAMETVTENSNLYLAQSNFVGSLKKIAVRHNVVIVLVAHPRKSNGDFTNDDVAGSGDITNKVDVVMSYQRCEDSEELYDGKLAITKNRLLGKYASGENAIELVYSEKTKRITGLSEGKKKYGWELDEEIKEAISLPF